MKINLKVLLICFLIANCPKVFSSSETDRYLKNDCYITTIDSLNKNKIFTFGSKKGSKSATSITQVIKYNDTIGYGFDFNTAKNVNLNNGVLSNNGFYFSVKLPEGNYEVEVTLGSKETPTITTIKAESRRLMLREYFLDKGEKNKIAFNVNRKSIKVNDSLHLQLKSREVNELNWDDKLTLEFLGTTAIQKIEIKKIERIRTLYIAGDSTVADQDIEPWAAWGQFITSYFGENIVIANYASSGASLSSFKSRYRFQKILSEINNGDYLIIEFGHNDEKIAGEGNGARGLYTQLLKEFVTETRKKGGIPILCTPVQRRFFNNDGTLKSTHGDFPDAMRKVAKDLNVPLIDLTNLTTQLYEAWGDDISKKAFVHFPSNTFPNQPNILEDNTHFNNFGADEISKCIVTGIRDLNLDLKQFLKSNLTDYNPKYPNNYKDWKLPMSLRFESIKPEGN